ncbi:dipeptidase PepV [Halanaerobium salsuginis]|jgi:succinyl-diaminopimelate desuccinylase|uniref:Succinyl-diaminopimelate desuccinylase n=1 Tax=Halanaerobium salsuginis TaxID=29563 RepID=A0A1I4FBA2_9FIRM|nr:dipeptidase PepV [Halanaerobium salsuginis]SFL13671.1 succinyl-diaminopimelate desuccinylase [Halanaerobium salsuginis]
MKEKIIEVADSLRDNMILSTQELVRIPSVEAVAEGNYPYGKNVYLALEKALEIAEKLGFRTKNIDNQAAKIEIGSGEETLAMLCHLDVVPEGDDWTYPPYAAEIHDNKIYGRGTIDDKGPAVAALYALKIVDLLNIDLKKRVQIILGTNEESGMAALEYYLKHEEMPDLAFSPDASFPVINAEKGILNLKFSADLTAAETKTGMPDLISLRGGNAANMVPDSAEAILSGLSAAELKEKLINFDYKPEKLKLVNTTAGLKINYQGVSAHGSTPEVGENAISQLLNLLAEIEFKNTKLNQFLAFYRQKIGLETDGKSIGCKDQDDIPTELTFNTGVIKIDADKAEFIVNIRYPVKSTAAKVINSIKQNTADNLVKVTQLSDSAPLYIAEDDPFLLKLMHAYREFTGDNAQPIAIGGGTYARNVKKGVAFGPLFPGEPELAHQRDEYIEIDSLVKSAAIYAQAIIDIAGGSSDE